MDGAERSESCCGFGCGVFIRSWWQRLYILEDIGSLPRNASAAVDLAGKNMTDKKFEPT